MRDGVEGREWSGVIALRDEPDGEKSWVLADSICVPEPVRPFSISARGLADRRALM